MSTLYDTLRNPRLSFYHKRQTACRFTLTEADLKQESNGLGREKKQQNNVKTKQTNRDIASDGLTLQPSDYRIFSSSPDKT